MAKWLNEKQKASENSVSSGKIHMVGSSTYEKKAEVREKDPGKDQVKRSQAHRAPSTLHPRQTRQTGLLGTRRPGQSGRYPPVWHSNASATAQASAATPSLKASLENIAIYK